VSEFGCVVGDKVEEVQEAQLSPRDRAMRGVS